MSSKNRLDKSAKMRKKREPASTADDLLSRKRLCLKAKKTPDNAGVFFCPVKKAAAGQFVFKDSP
ncbi:hypothetical protein [Ruminococcus callidus]|uniref:hypothetical protein n=1 Tax=Ruminococcus callidus TaxID=40519 RepID=UPI003520A425